MELREFLAWLTSGVGAGIASFFLMEKVPYLSNLPPEPKRYAAIALNARCPVCGGETYDGELCVGCTAELCGGRHGH